MAPLDDSLASLVCMAVTRLGHVPQLYLGITLIGTACYQTLSLKRFQLYEGTAYTRWSIRIKNKTT